MPYAGCPRQGTVRLWVAKLVMVLCCSYKNFTAVYSVFHTELSHSMKSTDCPVSVLACATKACITDFCFTDLRLCACQRKNPSLSKYSITSLCIRPGFGARNSTHSAILRLLRFFDGSLSRINYSSTSGKEVNLYTTENMR